MNNVYIVLEYDLTTERDREHVDVVKELGVKANRLYVIRCDDTAYIQLNNREASKIPVTAGFEIKDFEIEEIYISNPASATSGAKMVLILYGEKR